MIRSIILVTRAKWKNLQDFRIQLKEYGGELGRFEEFLQDVVQNIGCYLKYRKFIFWNEFPITIITLLVLIVKSENRDKLMNSFWDGFIGNDNFETGVANIYKIASIIVWSASHICILDRIINN